MNPLRSYHHSAKLYLSTTIIFGIGIILLRTVPYYQKTLFPATQKIILYLYLIVLLVSPFYYFLIATKYSTNKPYLFLAWCWKLITSLKTQQPKIQQKWVRMNGDERTATLFLLVKFFFLPLMLNFLYQNGSALLSFSLTNWSLNWYAFTLTAVFTADTFIFFVGYLVEARALKNTVRSVEPTVLGWAVTLLCYPPFNTIVGKYIPWGANDYIQFWNPTVTIIVRIVIVFLLLIYLSASITLGLRASNLTNRGIVTKFPYSIVRHPAYASKTTVWWLTMIPVMSLPFAAGMAFWTIIYLARAITEERHLKQDSEYQEYCQKVKHRFIPGII